MCFACFKQRGKKHEQQQENSVMNRFERWRSGEYVALWYEVASMKQAKNKSNTTIEALASRENTLSSGTVWSCGKDFIIGLNSTQQQKKPSLNSKNCIQRKTKFLSWWKTIAAKLINSMKERSFCSSCLCSIRDQSKRPMNSLTKLVNLASRGGLPSFVAPVLCSAPLTALNKKKTGIRTIGVGEVIQSLVAKCIAKEAAIEAVGLFGAKQLGIGVRGGVESIVHATKITFENMKIVKCGSILQIDFRNAFKSVKRCHLLGSTKKLVPSLMSFASFCYSKHSDLFFNSSTFDSQTGVQQCDPLAPLLFWSAIWPFIDEIESKLPNFLQHCWYLDDGIIAGTEIELCKVLEILSGSGEKFSLELMKDKCELWFFEGMTKVDSLIKRNGVEGIELLGAAIGSDAFASSCLLKRGKKNRGTSGQLSICRRSSICIWYFAFLLWCSQNGLLFAMPFSFGRIK